MQIGLLGKTNVGKSTFFSAVTETPVKIGNFPFTTIEPNIGITYATSRCPCTYFKIKHNNSLCINGTRLIPIKIIDIAGLVPGAHSGKGLGNKFLDDARRADILIHVVDISGSTDLYGHPISIGNNDPLNDIKFVDEELKQWFKQIMIREWKNLKEKNYSIPKMIDSITYRFSGMSIQKHNIQKLLKKLDLLKTPNKWNIEDIESFSFHLQKETKPVLIAANKIDLNHNIPLINKISHKYVIPCSAITELILRKANKSGIIRYFSGDPDFELLRSSISAQQLDALNKIKYTLKKITSTGVQFIINKAVFDILHLIVVYPVEDEYHICNKSKIILPDAKLLPHGSTVKDLAYSIHEDMVQGFIGAINVKTKKRIGEDYKLDHGDVIKIISTLNRK